MSCDASRDNRGYVKPVMARLLVLLTAPAAAFAESKFLSLGRRPAYGGVWQVLVAWQWDRMINELARENTDEIDFFICICWMIDSGNL